MSCKKRARRSAPIERFGWWCSPVPAAGFCSGIDLRDFGPSMLDASDPAIDRLRFQEMMAALPLALRACRNR